MYHNGVMTMVKMEITLRTDIFKKAKLKVDKQKTLVWKEGRKEGRKEVFTIYLFYLASFFLFMKQEDVVNKAM